ncbi:ubiquinol-cytochrome c reductase iron-sulfur subunit [Streptomyces sp. TS71-3]|uniref:cytochrome bc1 complex Rieske iron-sulfur subunit n=1 Tax=Streptomyces sp. TS71-3 TaxID=2733862 RepID=UPI001B12C367|nr:Rieske 2Fe-2S domain-containing protein [Streptomyces sp. TS71-3]GHJ38163.1 cytochrome bc1 complex Rieske iron-sulfur subunit [Streptomyces sp. TS71-3]
MSSHDMSDENLPVPSEAHGEVSLPDEDNPFADPGLPPHEHRIQDIDEQAAKRSERTVAFLFTLSMLGTIGFIASYFAIPREKSVYVFPIGHINAMNFALGLTLGVALFCIGAGAVHWARTLMSDAEIADERHPIEADPDTKQKVLADFAQGAKESALGRRGLIRTTMFGALALVPLGGVFLLGGLGPKPGTKLRHTMWTKGKLLVNMNTDQPLRPADIPVGSLTFAKPDGLEETNEDFQQQIAKAALMIIRLQPGNIKDKRELDWSHDGIVAYSKICTHVGCPISLYEQQTHHVLCPCHQSTFDLSDGGRVLFGPAGHALPQLRIGVNPDGFLEALGDFAEPVGPAFWERG